MAFKYADARRFALSLPGVSEEPHFGIPSFRVNKRMLVTVPPGDMLHVFVPDAERDMLLDIYANCTEKVYWGGKVVGIRVFLRKATRGAVADLILRAWKHRAPKKEVAAYEARKLQPVAKASKTRGKPALANKATGKVAATVDAYIAGFKAPIRTRLEQVRAAIRKAAPNAEEGISYRIPAYKLHGTLVYFAGFPKHIGLYPAPRSAPEFRDELAVYAGGKGTLQFPHDAPLPLDLIRRIVKFRAAANLAGKSAKQGSAGKRKPAAARKQPKKGKS